MTQNPQTKTPFPFACIESFSACSFVMASPHIPKRYALLVGIDLYRSDGSRKHENGQFVSLNWLRGCVNDVNSVKQFLQGGYRLAYLSILSSTATGPFDQYAKPHEPLDCLPTFDNIKREFDAIYDQTKAGDFFYFHFSGHGARLKRVPNSPPGRMVDPSILTWDYGCGNPAIRGWQLNSWFRKLNDKGVRLTVVLDSCHSGGAWRDDNGFRTQGNLTTVANLPIDEAAVVDFQYQPNHRDAELKTSWSINPDGFTLMAACDADEKAAEVNVDGKSHGVFTYQLLSYLERAWSDKRLKTYRMILDQVACQVQGQTPKGYGRDRLLFFDQIEPFTTTPLVVRIIEQGLSVGSRIVIVPAGLAHGVLPKSEFGPFPPVPESTFSVDEVDDFESKARIPPHIVQALQDSQLEVFPSRWSLGDRTFQVLVDTAFESDFRPSLCEAIQKRVCSSLEVLELASNDLDTALKVVKAGDDAKIFGPKDLIGHDGPVQGLKLTRGTDTGQFVSDVATVLTHIARFKHILGLQTEASKDQPPFKVQLEPKGLMLDTKHVTHGQEFRFRFESQDDEELYFTVINLGPGFHIQQLFPKQDSPQKVGPGLRRSFSFHVEISEQLNIGEQSVDGIAHRDIIRTVVTRGQGCSWKNLEMPYIWHADPIEFRRETSLARSTSLVADSEWWIQDLEIWTKWHSAHDHTS